MSKTDKLYEHIHQLAVLVADSEKELRALLAERDALRDALQTFVTVCDTAPPVEIIKHISDACIKARKALNTTLSEGEKNE